MSASIAGQYALLSAKLARFFPASIHFSLLEEFFYFVKSSDC